MAAIKQPRASFVTAVTKEEYTAAARVASRRRGWLCVARRGVLIGGGTTVALAWLLRGWPSAALLILAAGVLLFGGLCWLARLGVDHTAARHYAVFSALYATATVTLWEDERELSGPAWRRQYAYALIPLLVETRTAFVFLRGDGRFVVLPKRDIPVDGGRVTTFLRTVFARKYYHIR